MPFRIVRNDIVYMRVDAIVNTANPKPVIGAGTDSAIHAKAGPRLLQARKKIGDIAAGTAAVTAGYGLHANYVIHTVGPVWTDGSCGEEALLRQCYDSSLQLALKRRCKSVAFPLISAGTYGFPRDKALRIAMEAFSTFLLSHDMLIYLVVFNREAYQLSEKLLDSVASYIDDNYVDEAERAARRVRQQPTAVLQEPETEPTEPADWFSVSDTQICRLMFPQMQQEAMESAPKRSLTELLAKTDAGFTETLLKLIDQTGKKDAEIYRRANVSRQHFSKIRKDPAYKPTKPTVLAFAIALELDLAQTEDLLGRAGYALTNSSKFDVILRYFIEQGNYDMMQINTTLFEFDQSLLGV